ncbi:hypothetical protein BH11BAC4_BH11BAC4_09450 [soil metagenome]
MLQNRVDPFGNLIKTAARGSWTGTRGVIHNDEQEIIRPFKLKAWITCRLAFKGRKRKMMSPNKYTELFFLDEATAFAAGHRPCCECRREDFNKFKSAWLKGNPEYGFDIKTSIEYIDKIIHRERIDKHKAKQTSESDIDSIPNGSFIAFNNEPYIIAGGKFFLWTSFGYERAVVLPKPGKLAVLTPGSIVNTFRAGYIPQIADVPVA